jgi:HPt (histidine-containing phosphotransfer) domain-containing protein
MLSKWLPPAKIKTIDVSEENNEKHDMEADTSKTLDFKSALGMINEINTKVGISRVSGVENIYHDSLAMFTKKVNSECEQMFKFIKSENIDSFAIRVHAMKSMLSTIGAMSLSEKAAMLELAAKNKDLVYCLKHYPAYQAELLELHKKLIDIFPDEEKISEKLAGNVSYLNENLPNLLAAADDLDNETCVEILDLLLTYDFGDPVNTELQNVMMAVKEFNFDKAVDVLRGISV